MATLAFGGAGLVTFTPLSAALGDISNGAGTIALLMRLGGTPSGGEDFAGVTNSTQSTYYHNFGIENHGWLGDDTGASGYLHGTTAQSADASGAGNFRIWVLDWPSTAAAERVHWSSVISGAESWTHEATTANAPAAHAGPGTTGHFRLGDFNDYSPLTGEIALVGVWNVRLSDTDVTNLWANLKTSDWYNLSAGTPITLIECTSTTPTDIGSAPSTFSALSGVTATGADPTGWTFDGTGIVWTPETNADETVRLVHSTLQLR